MQNSVYINDPLKSFPIQKGNCSRTNASQIGNISLETEYVGMDKIDPVYTGINAPEHQTTKKGILLKLFWLCD